jgi:uncharacterized protein YgiM (DUF1202 family)
MVISSIDSYPLLVYHPASPVGSSLRFNGVASGTRKAGGASKMDKTTGKGPPGLWICALGLAICLMGCQPRVEKAPLPPPLPPAAAAPIPRPVRPTFYVTINQLSLRGCPGTDCHIITTLELNAEVEKMGETKNWSQVRVRKNGNIGYVSSRYLSPQPVQVAKLTKKKHKKVKSPKAKQSEVAAGEEKEAGPKEEGESSPPLPKAM